MSDSPPTTPATETRDPSLSRNARLLFSASIVAVLGCCVYYAVTANVDDPLELYQGLMIFVLATLPALNWAKSGGQQLPIFEVLMLTTASSFGMPMFNAAAKLHAYGPEVVINAGWAVILYQVCALATYHQVGGHPGRTTYFTQEVLSHDINRYIAYGLTLTTVYTYVSTFYDIIPPDLAGVFRAVFYGIGLVSVFVESRRWGLGTLGQREKMLFALNLAVQVVIQFSTLFLVGGISIVVLGLVGFVSGSRRLPFAATAVLVVVTGLLHSGKSDMRALYWDNEGNHRQPAALELPDFFMQWMQYGLTPTDAKEEGDTKIAGKLIDRTSLLQILCLVTSRTPEPLPYLGGETYEQIPGQFIPRFFWPEKPVGHVSTYTLSIYYGLQRQEDTVKTTIGFGMVAEAYSNFGMFGVALLGIFFGFAYKRVHVLSAASPLLSYAGIFQIVLMAWSFQTEYPMSMWLSSMFQACVAVMGLPFLIRNFLG